MQERFLMFGSTILLVAALGCSHPTIERRAIASAFVAVTAALDQLPEYNPAIDKELESRAMVAAYFGFSSALAQHPDCEEACRLALDHIKSTLSADAIGIADVLAIFDLLPIKELRSNSTVLFPTGTTLTIQKDLGMLEAVEDPSQLRGILRGVGKGILLARPEWRSTVPRKLPPLPFGRNVLYND